MTWLTRHFDDAELEVRADGGGRTVFGRLVPYESPTSIRDATGAYTETFAPGAFSKLVANPSQVGRVKLLAHHDSRTNPLGRAVELREDSTGLVGAFKISRTAAGDDALELVKDQALTGFSIGFEPVADEWNARRTEVVRRQANLREVSLVNFPAYSDALVGGVRALTVPHLSPELALRRLGVLKQGMQ